MVNFMSFSSGSCGNSYFLSYERKDGLKKGILIDAGVSIRRIKKVLMGYGLDYEAFGSILVTHDHMDHVRHLGSLCKRLQKPVYATSLLHSAFNGIPMIKPYISSCRHILKEGEWNEVDGFEVRYFIVPHDATQTVGYSIDAGGHKFVIMTDVGRMTEEALSFASQADTLVIESNYDVDMLISGPYTHELKMRICQGKGHLSNDECAEAIKKVWHPGLRNIFLCHLSENNNTLEKAYETALAAVRKAGAPDGFNLQPLPRATPSVLFTLDNAGL